MIPGVKTMARPDLPSGPMQVHERARSAGCYEFVEEHFFYDDQIDLQIVRDIHVFDPKYVPLLCRKVYLSPAGTEEVVDYHVIGRCIEHPREGYENAAVKIEGRWPMKLDRSKIHPLKLLAGKWPGPGDEGGPSTEWRINKPLPVVRPGRWLIEELESVTKFFNVGVQLSEKDGQLLQTGTVSSTMDRLNQILQSGRERDEKVQREAIAEARYRMRHNWRQMKDAIDNERWGPEPQGSKPFVDLGK